MSNLAMKTNPESEVHIYVPTKHVSRKSKSLSIYQTHHFEDIQIDLDPKRLIELVKQLSRMLDEVYSGYREIAGGRGRNMDDLKLMLEKIDQLSKRIDDRFDKIEKDTDRIIKIEEKIDKIQEKMVTKDDVETIIDAKLFKGIFLKVVLPICVSIITAAIIYVLGIKS